MDKELAIHQLHRIVFRITSHYLQSVIPAQVGKRFA